MNFCIILSYSIHYHMQLFFLTTVLGEYIGMPIVDLGVHLCLCICICLSSVLNHYLKKIMIWMTSNPVCILMGQRLLKKLFDYSKCGPTSAPPGPLLLTHWGRDKMAAISQTTLSNAFSRMKISEFWLKFHWSLFLRVWLTIFQHWFR